MLNMEMQVKTTVPKFILAQGLHHHSVLDAAKLACSFIVAEFGAVYYFVAARHQTRCCPGSTMK